MRVNSLWVVTRSKDNSIKSERYLYLNLSASVKSSVDADVQFKDDQDLLNHYEFSVSTELSTNPIPSDTVPTHDYTRKSLTAVTNVELQKNNLQSRNVCISYMSGLFQVLELPESLIKPGKS